MYLHHTTFEYLKPTDDQVLTMNTARGLSAAYARSLDALLPEGPDKTYIMRKVREVAMWANLALMRNADGSPR